MRERGWGRIVNISLSGVLQMEKMKHLAPDYCLGKAARAWMTTAFGLQEFPRGLTVNCIEPGPTEHMSFDDALKAAKGDYSCWQDRKNTTAHDIAEIIAFLSSEAGRFISGSTIRLPT
jgi:NAD(P)-dependent dehydrogenase (short-subunit alcohol dehydrogenase family)